MNGQEWWPQQGARTEEWQDIREHAVANHVVARNSGFQTRIYYYDNPNGNPPTSPFPGTTAVRYLDFQ
jgi:hypothetical protein